MRVSPPIMTLWALVLLAAGCAANSLLACGTGAVGLAVVATLTLGFRRGVFVALGVWLESQIFGFAVLGYPITSLTVAWGIALGIATALAAAIAQGAANRGPIASFALGFAGYESALAAFATLSGGGFAAFTPAIVGGLLVSNAGVALGAVALYRLIIFAERSIATGVWARRR
jgi:hypothetical protein